MLGCCAAQVRRLLVGGGGLFRSESTRVLCEPMSTAAGTAAAGCGSSSVGAAEKVGRKKQVVLPPTGLGNEFEVAAVRPPRALLGDLAPIFPAMDAPERLLVVPTVQRARLDLAGVGRAVEDEKDRLLDSFADWARVVCERLEAGGHWADFADPMTAMPARGPSGPAGYSEVEGFEVLLGYHVQNVGCCKIILHPKWQSRIYPATLFTTAPAAAVRAALQGSVLAPGAPVRILNVDSHAQDPENHLVAGTLVEVDHIDSSDSDGHCVNSPGRLRAVVDLDWVMADHRPARGFVQLSALVGERTKFTCKSEKLPLAGRVE